MLDPVKNFAIVTVSTGYDAAATSIVLSSGHGDKLPQPSTDGSFNLVWWNSTDYGNPSDDPNVEIVRCTARSTDTLTITRAQESTSATTKNTASKTYKMILAPTKKLIDDIQSEVQKSSWIYAEDSGASDAYAITLSPVPLAYATGMIIGFKANTANTGAATLNVNSLGAKTIKKNYDQDLADNDIKNGQRVVVIYDGTNFQMISQLGNVAAGGGTAQGIISTIFEGSGRFNNNGTGNATTTYDNSGAILTTSATANSTAAVSMESTGGVNWFTLGANNAFSTMVNLGTTLGTDLQAWVGVGIPTISGGSITYTNNQYGFKWVRASSSNTIGATQADGTTEVTTTVTGWSSNTWTNLYAIKTGTTNIKFYVDKVLKATQTTNFPTASVGALTRPAIGNTTVTTNSVMRIFSFSYMHDLV